MLQCKQSYTVLPYLAGLFCWTTLKRSLSDCFNLLRSAPKHNNAYGPGYSRHALMRATFALALLPILIAAPQFGGFQNGYPVIRGVAVTAIATPLGAIYFGDSEKHISVVQHEECHLRKMRKMGAIDYYTRYVTSSEWACNEERRCGWLGPHPACR